MNLLKSTTLLYFSLSIFFNSCSVEKRLYRPGYNVEWKTSKISASTFKNDDSSTDLIVIENRTKKPSFQEKEQNIFVPKKETQMEVENSCSDIQSITTKNNVHEVKNKIKEVKSKLITPKVKGIKNLKTIANKKISKTETQSGDGNGALKGIGWFFIILGIILLLFVSILIGILLMLLGLLFFIIGKSN